MLGRRAGEGCRVAEGARVSEDPSDLPEDKGGQRPGRSYFIRYLAGALADRVGAGARVPEGRWCSLELTATPLARVGVARPSAGSF